MANNLKMNVEIEFKTKISKTKYAELIKAFSLEGNVFKQTNFYFDTDNLDLNKQKMVLRIRERGTRSFKLTLKSQSEQGAYEYHCFLTQDQAEEMKQKGFNTKKYFDHIDFFVTFKTLLHNNRASTPYEGGTLFLDYNEYCGMTDYEIEYEVDHFEIGLAAWDKLLKDNKIKFVPTKRKSERALTCIVK